MAEQQPRLDDLLAAAGERTAQVLPTSDINESDRDAVQRAADAVEKRAGFPIVGAGERLTKRKKKHRK